VRAGPAFAVVIVLSLTGAALLMWSELSAPPASADDAGALEPTEAGAAPAPQEQNADAGTQDDAGDGAEDAGDPLPGPVPGYVRLDPSSATACPAGMLLVRGVECPYVGHRCLVPSGGGRDKSCARYAPTLLCEGRPVELRFCIDRFEYPNLMGVRPAVMVEYGEAQKACAVEGKRLCEAEEWFMACEGPGIWPYPTGLGLEAGTCNVSRPLRPVDGQALAVPKEVSVEVERLDQRSASGSLARCVSPFGIYDLVGNVGEWVHVRGSAGAHGPGHDRAVLGGGWGPPRACRSSPSAQASVARGPEIGFRCCRDPLDGKPARHMMPRGSRLPRKQRIVDPAAAPGEGANAAP
jgi:formylglycine-generating enzyme